MRTAHVYVGKELAAYFDEIEKGKHYRLRYLPDYQGSPISLTLPVRREVYEFESFPAFFDGLLPEGMQLEALLRQAKLDRDDLFGQLIQVGRDMVGAVSVREEPL
ncbi:MAG TPA: HipA N-terminal domain-containing protein [Candidatus Nitrosotenuis sp.]|jgi:serine/threonine-protein kinase HipA|nr:HipA N-terminal domain-containing protein [Candidatus Nitrosotenuis sp.]